MTAFVKKLGRFQATGLTVSIAVPTATMALDVSLADQPGKGHFSIAVTLIEDPALPESSKSREVGGESPRPERDAEEDVYGENGERMPYHPARPRQPRSGELAYEPLDRDGSLGPACRAGRHEN
jgi:hypothetical protein